jgi:4Fe-4S binding domain
MRVLRAVSLSVALGGFVGQFALLRKPGMPLWLSRGVFFALDPLILVQHLAATHKLLFHAVVALVPLAVTLVLGRFFCGWVCPFGAIHEFVSWIGRKRQKPSSRPNQNLLRIKYLSLAAEIVAALVRMAGPVRLADTQHCGGDRTGGAFVCSAERLGPRFDAAGSDWINFLAGDCPEYLEAAVLL